MRTLFCPVLIIYALLLASYSAAQSQPQSIDRPNLPIRFITVRYASAALIADLFGGTVIYGYEGSQMGSNAGASGNRGNAQSNRNQGGRNRGGGGQSSTTRNSYGGGRR